MNTCSIAFPSLAESSAITIAITTTNHHHQDIFFYQEKINSPAPSMILRRKQLISYLFFSLLHRQFILPTPR
jgi:hypothetical protein